MAAEPYAVTRTDLRDYFSLVAEGKVREIYRLDNFGSHDTLLFVATDRISAYDVIMKNGIPNKGIMLNLMSTMWFNLFKDKLPEVQTHFVSLNLPPALKERIPSHLVTQLQNRSMQVRKLKIFPIEAIVRGYITGSAWNEYREKGTVHGMYVSGPAGAKLCESERFVKPLYTPSTKAEVGEKDENIHPSEAARIVGEKYAARIEQLALQIYVTASDYAREHGIIIADTKFEFGLDENTDQVVLVDEVLTPDSSRFWAAKDYKVGKPQGSFDKQFMRDWLVKTGQKGKQDVEIPEDIALATADRYAQAFKALSGTTWNEAAMIASSSV